MSVHRTDTTCFDDDVLRSSSPVLVEFTADWCGPCRMMAPVLDQVADERAQSLRVVQVDTDADPALSIRFNILGLPTMAVFRDGLWRNKSLLVTLKRHQQAIVVVSEPRTPRARRAAWSRHQPARRTGPSRGASVRGRTPPWRG